MGKSLSLQEEAILKGLYCNDFCFLVCLFKLASVNFTTNLWVVPASFDHPSWSSGYEIPSKQDLIRAKNQSNKLRSGLVYEYKCGSCDATYYNKTKHHFKVRNCEHSYYISYWQKDEGWQM